MNDDTERNTNALSAFALATLLMDRRRLILYSALLGAVFAAAYAFTKRPAFTSSGSFVAQGGDASRANIANLAGQFGLNLGSAAGGQTLSPDYYVMLLKSRVLLRRVVRDSFAVAERGGERVPFLDLFEVPGDGGRREERGMQELSRRVQTGFTKTTGVVHFNVTTDWPSVSSDIATTMIRGVNEFNQFTRQGQASAERKFLEARLVVVTADLRAAEDRLEEFLKENKQFTTSPVLTFQRDRLQRAVTTQQQIFTSLTQSYEEARLREVRDTPAITVIEVPSPPALPRPRRRAVLTALGLILGAMVGALLAIVAHQTERRRAEGDPEVNDFFNRLSRLADAVRGPLRRR
jgi:uncharacterized protein involved in exopolysaccharide biosynthesis